MEGRQRSHERCAGRAAAMIESDSKAAITYLGDKSLKIKQ
jgi:hypothetical protein